MGKSVFCLMGPTACGKTLLACELSQRFPFEIISVDSAMIYRDMNIGTAKPSVEELSMAPHYLIDILDPPDSYSVAQFCEDAIERIECIHQRGKLPLLVGGSMMYFHALQQGLCALPKGDETTRTFILQQARQHGWSYLHQELTHVDPHSAAHIHPNDTQRLQRALEVYHLTGKPLSFFWTQAKEQERVHFVNIILFPLQREWLHQRIAWRFEQMLAQGLIEEVTQLLQKWQLSTTCPSLRSVGYRQVIQYLAGDYDDETLRYKGIVASRQLAKRQLTWLRKWKLQDDGPRESWEGHFFTGEPECMKKEIVAVIQKILDNTN